jgi:hypothetical protein
MKPFVVLPLHLDFGLVKIKVGHFDKERVVECCGIKKCTRGPQSRCSG